jgi:5-methylcytosine-specific restriction endonuclease McrA
MGVHGGTAVSKTVRAGSTPASSASVFIEGEIMSHMTLLLNNTYEPLQVISWQRAITLLWTNKVEVIEEHDEEIHSISFSMKIPSVLRMLLPVRIKRRAPVKFTRLNIFTRDQFKCQYCGNQFASEDLTFDHVVPVAQGGKKSWENIVSACVECNSKKEGRTPQQAGMKLLKKPKQPVWAQVVTVTIGLRKMPETWADYLYWTATLQ